MEKKIPVKELNRVVQTDKLNIVVQLPGLKGSTKVRKGEPEKKNSTY